VVREWNCQVCIARNRNEVKWKLIFVSNYYIHTILNQIGITNGTTQLLINAILQIINMIVATGMCFFVDRIGRRLPFLVATSCMLVVFVIWTICSARCAINGSKSSADAVVAMIYYVFYDMAGSGQLVGYAVEVLPFNIRAKVTYLQIFYQGLPELIVAGCGSFPALQPICEPNCAVSHQLKISIPNTTASSSMSSMDR
jgi:MFS family permease